MSIALHVPLTAGWHSKPLKTSLQQTGFLCQLMVICCFKYIRLISKLLINSCKTINGTLLYLFWDFHQISPFWVFLFCFVFSCGVAQDSRETCAFFGGCSEDSLTLLSHIQPALSTETIFNKAALLRGCKTPTPTHVSENGSMNSGLSSVCSHLYILTCLFLSFFENVCTPGIWRRTWDDLSVLLVSLLLYKCVHTQVYCFVLLVCFQELLIKMYKL